MVVICLHGVKKCRKEENQWNFEARIAEFFEGTRWCRTARA